LEFGFGGGCKHARAFWDHCEMCRNGFYRATTKAFWHLKIESKSRQSCQMVYFQTQNHNLGKFWRGLQWKMLVYFMDIWSIYGHLIYFIDICYILWSFGIFLLILVSCTKQNLANLLVTSTARAPSARLEISRNDKMLFTAWSR
jgi:hypothetical protein